MDYSRLRGRIRTYFHTQEAFAKAMGMSMCSLSKKLNGQSEWTADEMRKACDLLEIPVADIHLYFFAPKVEISQR